MLNNIPNERRRHRREPFLADAAHAGAFSPRPAPGARGRAGGDARDWIENAAVRLSMGVEMIMAFWLKRSRRTRVRADPQLNIMQLHLRSPVPRIGDLQRFVTHCRVT